MPRKPDGTGADRNSLAGDARRAAADLALAALRLRDLTGEPNWRPSILDGPTLKDLTDVRDQLAAILSTRGETT